MILSRQSITVLISMACFFYSIMQLSILNTLSTTLITHFDLTSTQYAWFSASFLYALCLSLLPAGVLLDRFATKPILVGALILLITTNIVFLITDSFMLGIVYRLSAGMFNAVAFLAMLKTIRLAFPQKIDFVTGFMIAFGMLGGFVAGAPIAYLLTRLTWQTLFYLLDGLGIVFAIVALASFQEIAFSKKPTNLQQFFKQLPSVITQKSNLFCGSYTGLLNLSVYIIATMLGNLFLIQQYHLSLAQASFVSSMIFIGIIIGSPLMGWFANLTQQRKSIMFFSGLGAVTLLLILLQHPSFTLLSLSLLFLLLGFFCSAQVLSYPIVASINRKEVVNTAMSFMLLLVNSIAAIIQTLISLVTYNTDLATLFNKALLQQALYFVLLAFFIAMILALFIRDNSIPA